MTQPIGPAGTRTLQLAGQAERSASEPSATASSSPGTDTASGADRVTISVEARQRFAVSIATSSSVHAAGSSTAGANSAPPSPAEEAAAIMHDMRGAFHTRAGEDGFDANLDFNQDGVINVQDMAVVRQKLAGATGQVTVVSDAMPDDTVDAAQPLASAPTDAVATAGNGTLDALRSAFYTREGEDGYNADVDFNSDGVIDARDLGLARRGEAETTQPVPPAITSAGDNPGNPVKETLNELRASFYTRAGEDGYNAAVDFNNDGVINVRDLAMARSGSVSGDSAFTQPVAPSETASAGFGERARTLIQQLREAFFSARGDTGFNAGLDANGDGRINVADLVAANNRVNEDT